MEPLSAQKQCKPFPSIRNILSLFAGYILIMCFSLDAVSSKELHSVTSSVQQPSLDNANHMLLFDEYLRRLIELEKQIGTANTNFLNQNSESPEKRASAVPFSGGVYGKRASIPFSGGVYGRKRASSNTLPFSGGLYGKRSGIIADLSAEEPLFFDRASISIRSPMPINGGLYGR
ncbi:Neuropeptide-Like Protein [Ditylenchus destructor]|nr:Neuropeptide-Like Protein [Ditylenchus destructor]